VELAFDDCDDGDDDMTRRRTGQSLIGFPLLGLVLRVLGTTLLVAVLLVGFVVGTQTGLRLAVALAEELAPDLVSVGSVEGRLWASSGSPT
jgi:hypothetical protein